MDEEKREQKTAGRILLLGAGAALVLLCVACVPLIRWMLLPEFGPWLRERVSGLGAWGILALLGVQVLQVVVAVIPGEPVELAAGAMYGAFGGLVLCLLGCLVGSAGVFLAVRKKGRAAFQDTALAAQLGQYRFLQSEARLEGLVFLLYFIPGTPKDLLVYVCALSPLPLGRFLFLSTLARIPSVVTSTWAGASFAEHRLLLTLGIFAGTGLLGLGGILFHRWFVGKRNREAESPEPEQF